MQSEDPFVYDEHGQPTGVKPVVQPPALSEGELHDVIVVTVAANEIEAIALLDALEEEGIPAMKRGGIVHLGASQPVEISIPRVLLYRGRETIAKFRGAAEERGVEEAFKPENIEEQWNDPKNPQMAAVLEMLAHANSAERERILFNCVIQALADGTPAPVLAQNLAAAGLSREEAEALIENVRTERMHLVREKIQARIQTWFIFGIVCLLAFIVSLIAAISARTEMHFVVAGSVGTVVGFGIAAHFKSKLSALDSGKK